MSYVAKLINYIPYSLHAENVTYNLYEKYQKKNVKKYACDKDVGIKSKRSKDRPVIIYFN